MSAYSQPPHHPAPLGPEQTEFVRLYVLTPGYALAYAGYRWHAAEPGSPAPPEGWPVLEVADARWVGLPPTDADGC